MLRCRCHAVILAAVAALATSSLPVLADSVPEPTVPQPQVSASKPSTPVVEQLVGGDATPKAVHRKAAVRRIVARRRIARRRHVPSDLDRPALAGVELLAPLPPSPEPPHFTVPLPAYGLDSIATALTTPAPSIVCHRTRRDPDVPDPHLYREVPVDCEPDNP